MKKLVILAIAAVMFTGCEQNLPNTSSGITTTTVSSENTTSEETATSITTAETASDTASTAIITTQPAPALTTAPTTAAPPVTTKVVTIAPPVTTVPLPVITTAPPATTAPNPGNGSLTFKQQVVNLVNAERAKVGLSQLSISIETERAAQVRASEIIINMSHTRPNGTSCFTALDGEGVRYTASGENIAGGQATPADVMKSWMNSAGHKANILNSNFTHIGIGYVEGGNYRTNWVQMFVRLA